MNLPNRLTMIRFILAIPFIIFLQYSDSSKYGLIFRLISLVIFVIASLTDFFDGYIARKYNLITDFGKIMDPLADKILVISALVIFVQLEYIPGWMSIIVLAREFLISGIRILAAAKGEIIAAGNLGKYKTTSQMLVVIIALAIGPVGFYISDYFFTIAEVLMLIPVILTYSGTGDDDNNFKIKTVVEDLTQEKYKEIKDKNPDEIPAMNGVGNDIPDFADGRFAGTLTPDEHKRIKKGETIKKIGIFNPTNGLIADVAEAIIGQAGLIFGGNWNGKQLHQIEKEYKGIFNNGMIAHSQGTIIYASKLRDDLETEEGRLKISKMKENYFLGIAVVPWILDDTIDKMKALGTKAEKRRNNYDFVSIITLNLRANTTGTGHGVVGYNPYYFRWNSDISKFDVNKRLTGPLPIIKENEVINKVGVYQ